MLSLEAEKALLVLRQDHEHLFFIGKGNFEAIIRPLTLGESKIVISAGGRLLDVELNDWLVRKCCLHVSGGVDNLLSIAPAGIADKVASGIVAISKFESQENLVTGIKEARKNLELYENQVALFILDAFRSLTPKDIDNMTFYTQMKYLVLAEQLTGKPLPVEYEMKEEVDGKGRRFSKRLSSEAARLLSREAADKPDIGKDNIAIMGV
jgi:hypothetical protein